jgi:hypothetical protein
MDKKNKTLKRASHFNNPNSSITPLPISLRNNKYPSHISEVGVKSKGEWNFIKKVNAGANNMSKQLINLHDNHGQYMNGLKKTTIGKDNILGGSLIVRVKSARADRKAEQPIIRREIDDKKS